MQSKLTTNSFLSSLKPCVCLCEIENSTNNRVIPLLLFLVVCVQKHGITKMRRCVYMRVYLINRFIYCSYRKKDSNFNIHLPIINRFIVLFSSLFFMPCIESEIISFSYVLYFIFFCRIYF